MPKGVSRDDEMRPVTALFADIVGSTGLGERLGPDEVKALVGEFVTRMSRAVEEFGGVVQAYMGDGICAYFGVPAPTRTIRNELLGPRFASSGSRPSTRPRSRLRGGSPGSTSESW